jgi:hypothetical protein
MEAGKKVNSHHIDHQGIFFTQWPKLLLLQPIRFTTPAPPKTGGELAILRLGADMDVRITRN